MRKSHYEELDFLCVYAASSVESTALLREMHPESEESTVRSGRRAECGIRPSWAESDCQRECGPWASAAKGPTREEEIALLEHGNNGNKILLSLELPIDLYNCNLRACDQVLLHSSESFLAGKKLILFISSTWGFLRLIYLRLHTTDLQMLFQQCSRWETLFLWKRFEFFTCTYLLILQEIRCEFLYTRKTKCVGNSLVWLFYWLHKLFLQLAIWRLQFSPEYKFSLQYSNSP
jgi:hypothetical protein